MRYTTYDAFTTILIEPCEIRAVGGGLFIEKAGNRRKSLSSAEQRPAIDVIAIYWSVNFEEWSDCSDIDA